METYARHIVYRKRGDDQFRPYASFHTLREAVWYADSTGVRGERIKVIDLEHIDLGDMLVAEECADLVARIRAEAGSPPTDADLARAYYPRGD